MSILNTDTWSVNEAISRKLLIGSIAYDENDTDRTKPYFVLNVDGGGNPTVIGYIPRFKNSTGIYPILYDNSDILKIQDSLRKKDCKYKDWIIPDERWYKKTFGGDENKKYFGNLIKNIEKVFGRSQVSDFGILWTSSTIRIEGIPKYMWRKLNNIQRVGVIIDQHRGYYNGPDKLFQFFRCSKPWKFPVMIIKNVDNPDKLIINF